MAAVHQRSFPDNCKLHPHQIKSLLTVMYMEDGRIIYDWHYQFDVHVKIWKLMRGFDPNKSTIWEIEK